MAFTDYQFGSSAVVAKFSIDGAPTPTRCVGTFGNPDRVLAQDLSYASGTFGSQTDGCVKVTGFPFSSLIPAYATITQIRVRCYQDIPSFQSFNHAVGAHLFVNDVQKGNAKSVNLTSGSPQYVTIQGEPLSFWGAVFYPSDFYEANFHIIAFMGDRSNNNVGMMLDSVEIRIDFSGHLVEGKRLGTVLNT
jgi:hypothetical protein